MLGMIFGVGAVIAMLSIGAGAEKQAMEMIDRLGARNVLIRDLEFPDEKLEEIRKNSPGVSPRDAEAITDAVPGVQACSLRVEIKPDSVLADSLTAEATAHGVSASYAELTDLPLGEGRFIDEIDILQHAQVCVIGASVRRELFGFTPVLGKVLKVNDVWLEVVGVLRETGAEKNVQGISVASTDSDIYLPVSTALRKFDAPHLQSPLDEIIVQLKPDVRPRQAGALMGVLLNRMHGGEEDFEIIVPEKLLDQSRRTQRMFSIVMGCIAGISLLVGGIGIMNIMLATVFERTREIGIRRAVGARPRDIRSLFLMESFAISVVGGFIGIIFGISIAHLVAASAGWETVVTPVSVILSSTVSIAVGLASGLYPAVKAAQLNPIDALRWE